MCAAIVNYRYIKIVLSDLDGGKEIRKKIRKETWGTKKSARRRTSFTVSMIRQCVTQDVTLRET